MVDKPTLGLAVPLSGTLGDIGRSVLTGAKVAAETAAGPAQRLAVEDTRGDPDRAASAAEALIDAGAVVVGGAISSDVALAVRAVCERRRVPHLPAMGGNPALTRPGTRYTCRFSSSNRQSGLGTVRFFRSRGVERIAIVGADFSYPRTVTAAVREFGADRGLAVEAAEFVPLGSGDFGPAIDGVPRDVDGLFLPYPGREAVELLGQLQEAGFGAVTVLGDYSFGSAPYRDRLGSAIEGTFNWGVDGDSPAGRALAEAVRRRSGGRAGVYHHFGFDVVGLARAAQAAAETPTPTAVRDALATIEYEAVSGWTVAFDADGCNVRYRMLVAEWVRRDGGLANEVTFRSGPLDPG